MRKTTTYSRKLNRAQHYNGVAFLNVIQRSRPYDTEPIPGMSDGSQCAADRAMLLVRDAFVSIKAGDADPSQSRQFDLIAHALGVAFLRAVDIAGEDAFDNPMLPIWRAGNEALRRCLQRFNRIGKWGFDGPALDELDAAVELYETIVQASSPAQMDEASVRRLEVLAEMRRLRA